MGIHDLPIFAFHVQSRPLPPFCKDYEQDYPIDRLVHYLMGLIKPLYDGGGILYSL